MVDHVLAAVSRVGAKHTVVVVGHGRDEVISHLQNWPDVTIAVQETQDGTGHAVAVALAALPESISGPALVLSGDAPLITEADLENLIATVTDYSAAILTAELADADGYGRIVHDSDGTVLKIVEHRDANESELNIKQVNSGTYCFEVSELRTALGEVNRDNAQGEIYLTDVISILRNQGKQVTTVVTSDENILGINDRVQLAQATGIMRSRILNDWMRSGVTIEDPATTWIESAVELESDVTLLSNVRLTGNCRIASGAIVGPDCTLEDTEVLAGARVLKATAIGAVIGAQATVGPYTYLRPGTVLGASAKAGGFVEMKNARLGDGAKVPHLSYVGDAQIGEGSNIGAATIFVNFDGEAKHETIVGKHARIGSDTMLVAPVTVGDGAYTAAGSVITEDVPPGAMGVGRARQRNILDWVLRRRPGSDSANAAVADSDSKDS